MLEYIIKVTLCWLGFYLIYFAFLKKETFFNINRWYLLATLIIGAMIPLVDFLPELQNDNPVAVYIMPLSDTVQSVQVTVSEVVTTSSFDWMALFWAVYLTGIGISAFRFLVGLGKIYQLYSTSEVSNYKSYKLVMTDKIHLPFSFFNYLFWSKSLELNDADGQKIVTHEEAHVQGWHSVDVLLLEILSIIFWISPMVYFYKKSIRTVHEYLADAVVLQTTPTKKYGHLLLRQSQSGLQVALANNFIHSQLKQRIVMMTRNKSNRQAMIKYLFAAPVIVLLFTLFSKKEINAQTNNNQLETVNVVAHGTTNATANFDRQQVKNELKKTTDKYDKNASYDKNKKVQSELTKAMRSNMQKYYANRSAVVSIVTELIKEIKAPWAIESKNVGGVSVIDWEPILKKDYINVKKISDALEMGPNTHVSLKSMLTDAVKNPLVYVDRKKNTSSDPMYFTIGRIKSIEVVTELSDMIQYGPAKDNDVVLLFNMKEIDADFDKNTYAILTKGYANNRKKYQIVSKSSNQTELDKVIPKSETIVTIEKENGDIERTVIYHDVDTDPVFKVVEEMPRFPGCEDKTDSNERKKCAEMEMLKFIYSNIKYPAAARNADIQGKVIIQFVVKKDGSITDVNVRRDIGGGCGDESKRVVENMPNWIPGKQSGEAVNVQYTLPVAFRLEGDNAESKKPKLQPEGEFLIVIDGEKIGKRNVSDIDAINLKPDEIKSIDIIKGGKATELFGEDGKDGVIFIVTKAAKSNNHSNLKLEEVPADDGSGETKIVWKKMTAQDAGFTLIKVSPNPTSGKINIEFENENRDEKISIIGTDINGKEIFNFNRPGGRSSINDVDISKAAKGIIFVTFRQGENTYTEKIILQ